MNLTTNNNMATPPNNSLESWLTFFETLFPFATVFGAVWKGIHELFKYLSDKRKNELKEMIKDQVEPQIEKLAESIDRLDASIRDINNRR